MGWGGRRGWRVGERGRERYIEREREGEGETGVGRNTASESKTETEVGVHVEERVKDDR